MQSYHLLFSGRIKRASDKKKSHKNNLIGFNSIFLVNESNYGCLNVVKFSKRFQNNDQQKHYYDIILFVVF